MVVVGWRAPPVNEADNGQVEKLEEEGFYLLNWVGIGGKCALKTEMNEVGQHNKKLFEVAAVCVVHLPVETRSVLAITTFQQR